MRKPSLSGLRGFKPTGVNIPKEWVEQAKEEISKAKEPETAPSPVKEEIQIDSKENETSKIESIPEVASALSERSDDLRADFEKKELKSKEEVTDKISEAKKEETKPSSPLVDNAPSVEIPQRPTKEARKAAVKPSKRAVRPKKQAKENVEQNNTEESPVSNLDYTQNRDLLVRLINLSPVSRVFIKYIMRNATLRNGSYSFILIYKTLLHEIMLTTGEKYSYPTVYKSLNVELEELDDLIKINKINNKRGKVSRKCCSVEISRSNGEKLLKVLSLIDKI